MSAVMRLLWAALFAAALIAAPAGAQVYQSGTVSPGHVGVWVSSGLMKDGGSGSNFQANAFGLYNGANNPLAISSTTSPGALSGTWGTLTFGVTSTAANLTAANSAGGLMPININPGSGAVISLGGANWLSTNFDSQFCSAQGSVLYRSGSLWTCLPPGSSGQVLQTQGPNLNPQWAGSGGIGTVTSVTAGTGLSGGTIATSGTIALVSPVTVSLGGTGAATLAAHGVLLGNGTTAVNVATPGASGTVLQSNGASADPTWNAVAGTGTLTSLSAADGTITASPSTITTSGTVKVATNGVANANLAQMAANTIKGNNTGSPANAADLTVAQTLTMLGLTVTGPTTWTPTDASGGSLTFTVTNAEYYQIGKLVSVTFEIAWPATADVNSVLIGGLPAAAFTSTNRIQTGSLSLNNGVAADTVAAVTPNATTFTIQSIAASRPTNAQMSTATIRGSITYFTN